MVPMCAYRLHIHTCIHHQRRLRPGSVSPFPRQQEAPGGRIACTLRNDGTIASQKNNILERVRLDRKFMGSG